MSRKPPKLPARPSMPEFGPKKVDPQPQVKGQIFLRIICPFCKSPRVKMLRSIPARGIRYYECQDCCAYDSNPTPFKIQERTHEQASQRPEAQEGTGGEEDPGQSAEARSKRKG
jgi:hypothetical protein